MHKSKNNFSEITKCRLCGNKKLKKFIDFGRAPLGNNLQEKYFISNPYIASSDALFATLILILFGAIAGYIPARKAANIKPIIALRDK